jgi:Cu2+-exporting ATPase
MLFTTLVLSGTALATVRVLKRSRWVKRLRLTRNNPPEATDSPREISLAEKELNQKAVLFAGSLGTASLAYTLSPPLGLIGLPVTFYILKDVFVGSYQSLTQKKAMNVDTMVAFLSSTLIISGHFMMCNYYLILYLVNRKLMLKLKNSSSKSIIDVFKQQPATVYVLVNGVETEVPFITVNCGDIVVVAAGQKIPVDGTVSAGQATVDQHLLTGESQPVEKDQGDLVFALTIVLAGRLEIRVDKTGEETTVAQIGKILNQTIEMKTETQLWSERITDKTVMPTFLLSGAVLPVFGPMSAMIVLNSHFRYRLSIITSTSVLNFLNLSAQKGLLIKDGRTLETMKKIDTVVFDKTGTLTLDQPHVANIHCLEGIDETTVLGYAAAAEAKQEHPIARAILEAAQAKGAISPLDMDDEQIEYRLGYGVRIAILDQQVRVGSARFMQMEGCLLDDALQTSCDTALQLGNSVVLVALDAQVIGVIELHPTIRPEAQAVVDCLRNQYGAEIHIISGDQETPTRKLAEKLGIEHYFAETLPENKADLIAQLQAQGRSVCYIGDGINDSIALKQADVSVSMRGASGIAMDAAEVILMDGKLNQLTELFKLSGEFRKNMSLTSKFILVPCAISLGGAVVPGFTLLDSMILSSVSVVAGFSGAMWPLLQHEKQEPRKETKS